MESTFSQTASTVLINVSLAWIVGVLASRFWLVIRTTPWQDAAVKRLSLAMVAGLVACVGGILLSLWSESAAMGDVPWLEAGPAFKAMLVSTHYGHAGSAATAILIVALFVHWGLTRTRAQVGYVGIMTALVFLVAAARVTIGHAFEHGPWSLAVFAEWLHLLSMAVWVGIVFVAGWVVLPRVLSDEIYPSKERSAYLTSMSDWAAVALVVILATGAYNSYRVLNSPRDLLETDYGHVLVFKLVCVAVAIVLGGINKFYGLPAAINANLEKAQRGIRVVIAILRVEAVVLLSVLVAAAMMTTSAPPGG